MGSWSNEEVVVAVMGVTGAGKSSFIQDVTGDKNILIGHDLESATSEVQSYKFQHQNTTFVLVDTPGFNDTHNSDEVIMTRVLKWLESSYRAGTRLNGVIYLHRIIDARMQGHALNNVRMFRRLCGPDSFKNVVLATTFWEEVAAQTGAAREKELCENKQFWGLMVNKGSEIVRLHRNRGSSLEVLMRFAKKAKTTLQAQDEIVNQKKSLKGTVVAEEMATLQREMEEKIQAEKEQAARKLRRNEQQRKWKLEEERKRFERERKEREERERREEQEAARRLQAYLRKQQEEQQKLRREAERIEAERQRRIEQEREAAAARERVEAFLERRRQMEEAEMREREEKRQADERARIERLYREEEERQGRRIQEAYEERQNYYRRYVCRRYSVAHRLCDKCHGSLHKRWKHYYHCCHCDGDDYNQCGGCGGCCPVGEHPFMTRRETLDECVVM